MDFASLDHYESSRPKMNLIQTKGRFSLMELPAELRVKVCIAFYCGVPIFFMPVLHMNADMLCSIYRLMTFQECLGHLVGQQVPL